MSATWIEISKDAVLHNIAQIRAQLSPAATLGLVIKGNAYGHGLTEMMRIVNRHPDVGYLFVASLAEALQVRALGVRTPLCALVPADTEHLAEAIAAEVAMVCGSEYAATMIAQTARTVGVPALVHIKIDTGLCRLGVCPHESMQMCERIFSEKCLRVVGVSTHLADVVSDDISRAHEQMAAFDRVSAQLRSEGYEWQYTHACASGAIIFAQGGTRNDTLVRVGTLLYGYEKSPHQRQRFAAQGWQGSLQPVMTWKTKIWEVRDIAAQNFIGYGDSFYATRPMRLAILPVGYADGYPRGLSNTGAVVIRGRFAPVIGRVSMNIMAVDVSEIAEVDRDDEVLLMGNTPGITADDLAELSGTVNLDILTQMRSAITRHII